MEIIESKKNDLNSPDIMGTQALDANGMAVNSGEVNISQTNEMPTVVGALTLPITRSGTQSALQSQHGNNSSSGKGR